MARTTARVEDGMLVIAGNDTNPIRVGTDPWFAWLETAMAFVFASPCGSFTARKERRSRGGWYWKAYRTENNVLRRVYLGKSPDLTLNQLTHAATSLTNALTTTAPVLTQATELPLDSSTAITPPAKPRFAHLLATKFFVPPARANLVERPRLFERLQAGLRHKLTLIAAPAGSGKTTLLSEWRATPTGAAMPFAWVALDRADNDPLRFWSYVIAAIDTLAPDAGMGASAIALLQSPQPPAIEQILINVLNAFSTSVTDAPKRDFALALDDYHVITVPAIHATLAWLLDYLPANLHLVILTRADPALPLPRLRARGELTELRASDLRFTPAEAATFLNPMMGLALTASDVTALEARTEGWIAGLQLAALAMRDHHDRAAFIRSFSGSNRFIVDYLAAEVFASQSTEIQDFLLRTAILDRMCGALCDAVFAQDSQALTRATPSQLLLEELERANLFVVPLDDERQWYRYHHLFAEVLRQRLTKSTSAVAIANLHRRASAWYAGQVLIAEAVQHALAASDDEQVAHLIEQYGLRIIVGGQVYTVLQWLSTLSDSLIRSRPMLCIIHALALLFTNQLIAAEDRIQDAERCIQPDTPIDQIHLIQGRAAAIRANIARYIGDIASCVNYGQTVLRLLPETETIARTIALLHAARAFRVSGDVTSDVEHRASALIAPFQAAGNMLGMLAAITNLARLQVMQGQLRHAATTYRTMAQRAISPDQPLLLEGPAYYVGMSELLYEWNELVEAERHLAEAMKQLEGRIVVDAEDVMLGYLTLARLQRAHGEHSAANATLQSYIDLARRRGFVAHLVTRVTAVQAQFALSQGDLAATMAWADGSGLNAADELNLAHETEYLTLARVWMAQAVHQSDPALFGQTFDLLNRLLTQAIAQGRMGSVLDSLIVQALGQWSQKANRAALTTLHHALTLAAPEGYIRRFVDEGQPMLAMLHAVAKDGIAPDASYLNQLLATFPETQVPALRAEDSLPNIAPPNRPTTNAMPPLVEPLSKRELEVLRLIAAGKSNAEVAQTLVVALSTVKAHINSIFGKLQVISRAQALARAHELQLI